MIGKWVVLNIFITFMIIVIVGYSIKEFACYQFNLYSPSPGQSEQFRNIIETYLLYAGIVAFVLAIVIHLFFARKILQPLRQLIPNNAKTSQLHAVTSNDEVGLIAKDIMRISNQVNDLQKQNEQMMNDLAHELRTPLTTLYGYLEGLTDGVFAFDDSTKALLIKECEHLVAFIERVNEWHEWKHVDFVTTEVNMKDVFKIVIHEYDNEIKKAGLRLQTQISSCSIYTNAEALRTVFREFIENVLHYHDGIDVVVKGELEADQFLFSISNDGLPFGKHAEERLFERFYRVEPSRNRHTGGSGLGLAIVKEIVSRLGGEVGYISNERIHTFWFSIPLI